MTDDLESILESDDPWPKHREFNFLVKLGQWVSYASLAFVAFTGISYASGANWAEDLRASFDRKYSFRLEGERAVEDGSYYTKPDSHGISLECQLAVYNHIFDEEFANFDDNTKDFALIFAEGFVNMMKPYVDVNGDKISDPDLYVKLYKKGAVQFIGTDEFHELHRFLEDSLKTHTWDEVAELVREKYK